MKRNVFHGDQLGDTFTDDEEEDDDWVITMGVVRVEYGEERCERTGEGISA